MNPNVRRLSNLIGPPTRLLRFGRRKTLAALLAIGLFVGLAAAWPALAQVKLAYFTAESTDIDLTLKWASLIETNLARWEVYCKGELEPPIAYHAIGTVAGLGQSGGGASYTFPVPELTPSTSYCFRITEGTIDGTLGESFDLCGFGYGVTPTPTPIPPDDAGVVGSSPVGSLSAPISSSGYAVAQDMPTSTPTSVPVQPPSATPTQVVVSPLDPGAEAVITVGPAAGQGEPITSGGEGDIADAGAVAVATVTPVTDPGYIVVTATPTTQAVAAQLQPTFTPLPTATAEPAALLADMSEWRAENLVLASLCFVFFGAGGLGILGIIALGLYLRSRSDAGNRDVYPFDDFPRT